VVPLKIHCNHLPGCMNTGIRPSSGENGSAQPAKLTKRFFHLTLNRPITFLALKALEACTVVGKNNLVTFHTPVGGLANVEFYSTSSKRTISAESPCRSPSLEILV